MGAFFSRFRVLALSNARRIRFRWTIGTFFALLGAYWTLAEMAINLLPESTIEKLLRDSFWPFVILSTLFSVAINFRWRLGTYRLKGRKETISLSPGSLLKDSAGSFLLIINNELGIDTKAENISSDSLLAKFISKHWGTDVQLDDLRSELRKNVIGEDATEADGSFKIGVATYAKLPSSPDRHVYFAILTPHAAVGSIDGDRAELIRHIVPLFERMHAHLPRTSLALPLLGTGHSGMRLVWHESAALIIAAYIAASRNSSVPPEVKIKIPYDILADEVIDFEGLIKFAEFFDQVGVELLESLSRTAFFERRYAGDKVCHI